jgi:LPXTG-motif cell wall-anchored protein
MGGLADAGDGTVPSDGAAASAGGFGDPTTAASAPVSEQVAAKTAPQTGDATSAAVPLGFGAAGAALAALSLRMRRRASRR